MPYIFSLFLTALSWKIEPIDRAKYKFSRGTIIEQRTYSAALKKHEQKAYVVIYRYIFTNE